MADIIIDLSKINERDLFVSVLPSSYRQVLLQQADILSEKLQELTELFTLVKDMIMGYEPGTLTVEQKDALGEGFKALNLLIDNAILASWKPPADAEPITGQTGRVEWRCRTGHGSSR
jgi:hypothetical protein